MHSKTKRSEAKENTRCILMQTSLELFASNGFNGTSMEMIARKAGVSKGLAYTYFASKNEILIEIIKTFTDKKRTILKSIIGESTTPFEKIKKLIESAVDTDAENEAGRDMHRLLYMIKLQPGFSEMLQSLSSEMKPQILEDMEMIDSLLKKIGVKNPAKEREYIKTVITGIMILYLSCPKDPPFPYPYEQLKKDLIDRYRPENWK
ncbi:MAG TPA: TetR/AcrR family transcriptional regulator [Leptospiraceae bacterium]|nr:TetR/AcrR family transcriptional regulator [Leptospiraceae bacterium]HNF24837.1 TetR/AcrR family transcriptional regulator [Leptospiraceae bacterium]HNH07703.1 TetR/AcrR family transcriptional regulator [Leptospiraceae bacterium]HNI27370.1 TetR/AcrR family transcriptional regulator [Leptospiraceae bacterium]